MPQFPAGPFHVLPDGAADDDDRVGKRFVEFYPHWVVPNTKLKSNFQHILVKQVPKSWLFILTIIKRHDF